MKIAVDCRALTTVRTGGGYYTENLIGGLLKTDSSNSYLLCAHKDFALGFAGDNCSKLISNCFSGFLWQNTFLPRDLARAKADVFHSPLFTLPFSSDCPGIVTVFDLTPMIYPELHLSRVRLAFIPIRRSVKRARKIIAISEQTKKDIMEHLGIEEEKITVIYPGVKGSFKPADEDETKRIRAKYAGGNNYMLHVGTLEPRKNLAFLIDVFREMINTGVDRGLDLMLVGAKGWKYDEIFGRIAEYGLRDRVRWVGYADIDDMPGIYSAAEIFLYPSLYEGFGLPVLEAMACGVPVVASSTSSIPEVLGDAGVLMKGWNVQEWCVTVHLLLSDSGMSKEFEGKGRRRSTRFTWEDCADKTLDLYNSLGV